MMESLSLNQTSQIRRVWSHESLILDSWRRSFGREGWSVLNNAVVRHRDALLMCYRVVAPAGQRWLAMCRLTESLDIVPESMTLTSESFGDAPEWHADPRLISVGDRLYLTYSSRINDPEKRYDIFIVEIDPDTLRARAAPRVMQIDGPRRIVEKNWMPFCVDDRMWMVYSAVPHVVMQVELPDTGSVICRPTHRVEWDASAYASRFGELRGGAPPALHDGEFVSFVHSSYPAPRWRRLWLRLRRRPGRLHYAGGVYAFDAQPPFAPRRLSALPILAPSTLPRRFSSQLDKRVDRSVYPCGAIRHGHGWLLSFGAQEEYCCLAAIDDSIVQRSLAPMHGERHRAEVRR